MENRESDSCTKNAQYKELDDYRPVALTSVPLKSFEIIILNQLVKEVDSYLDCHQYTYMVL